MIPTLAALVEFKAFTLVLFRMSGLFLSAPLLGNRDIPLQVKIGLAALTAFLIFPSVPHAAEALPRNLGGYVGFAAAELAVGVTVGLAASMLLSAFQLAGQHVGTQMGLSMADIVDPFSDTEVSVVGQFHFFLALAVYVAAGAHRWLLGAVADSFRSVPLGGFRPTEALVQMLVDAFGTILMLSFQITAPVLVALFLSTVALGFVARAVPQMNVLLLSFPIQIGLGLGIFLWTLPGLGALSLNLFETLASDVQRLLGAMVPDA